MGTKKIAVITARGGSKRIPKKNIKEFCGKPIIAYSIEAALRSELFDEVMVSTESKEIAEVAKKYGANVPFLRSDRLANDFASTDEVIVEVLLEYKKRGMDYDIVACLYPTAPFVTAERIRDAIDIIEHTPCAEQVTPVVKYSYPPQRSYVIKEGFLEFQYPQYEFTRSQDLETIYHDCGQFYIMDAKVMLEKSTQRKEVPIVISEMEVQDIDSEDDWKIAEIKYKLMCEKRDSN